MLDRVAEAALEPGELAEHGVAADVQPRVLDRAQPALHLVAGRGGPRRVAGRDRGARREQGVGGLVPGPVEPLVELARAGRQLERALPLAAVGDDVGEEIGGARPDLAVLGERGRLVDVPPGRLQVA